MSAVYLAGGITGLKYQEADSWRQHAASRLRRFGIEVFSPTRAKGYLSTQGALPSRIQGTHPLSTDKGIVTRDRNDCMRSDLVLMNLLGAERVSIGTMIEAGWADAARNPIVLAMEPSGNVHEHAMLHEVAGFIVPTLDEAIDLTVSVLLEG